MCRVEAVWNVECKAWSVESNVECGVQRVKCKV